MRTVHELGDIVPVSVGNAKARVIRVEAGGYHWKKRTSKAKKLWRALRQTAQRLRAP